MVRDTLKGRLVLRRAAARQQLDDSGFFGRHSSALLGGIGPLVASQGRAAEERLLPSSRRTALGATPVTHKQSCQRAWRTRESRRAALALVSALRDPALALTSRRVPLFVHTGSELPLECPKYPRSPRRSLVKWPTPDGGLGLHSGSEGSSRRAAVPPGGSASTRRPKDARLSLRSRRPCRWQRRSCRPAE